MTALNLFKKKTPKDDYWHRLILSTGYTESISDLSSYQLSFLEKIKEGFQKHETYFYNEAKEIYDEFYGDENDISDLDLNGLNLPPEDSNTWELYFEHLGTDNEGDDKYYIVILIIENFEVVDYTGVN